MPKVWLWLPMGVVLFHARSTTLSRSEIFTARSRSSPCIPIASWEWQCHLIEVTWCRAFGAAAVFRICGAWQQVAVLQGQCAYFFSIAVSPDGREVICGKNEKACAFVEHLHWGRRHD